MCSLRDAATELVGLGVDIYGVSRDSVEDMGKFAKEQSLPFRLLSDPDGSVTRKLEVDMAGRPLAKRVTIVLDKAGVIRARDEEVKVDAHGQDLIARIAELQGEVK